MMLIVPVTDAGFAAVSISGAAVGCGEAEEHAASEILSIAVAAIVASHRRLDVFGDICVSNLLIVTDRFIRCCCEGHPSALQGQTMI